MLRRTQDALAEEIGLMLDEGVVAGPEDIDLCMILGAGWPMFLGGITPYLDRVGASERVNGKRFLPPGVASRRRCGWVRPAGLRCRRAAWAGRSVGQRPVSRHQPAAGQPHNAVRRRPGVVHVMGDQHDGGARLCGRPHRGVQHRQAVAVQRDGGLVQGHDGWPARQDRGQGQEPLVGGGQFGGVSACRLPARPDGGQGAPQPVRPLRRAGQAVQAQSRPPAPAVRSNSWSRGCWKSSPTRAASVPRRQPGNILPVDQHIAGQRPQQSVEVPQQGRFPGAVRPRDGNNLARMHRQADARPGRRAASVPAAACLLREPCRRGAGGAAP